MHLFRYYISCFFLRCMTNLRFISSMSDFILYNGFFKQCFAKNNSIRFIIISMWDLSSYILDILRLGHLSVKLLNDITIRPYTCTLFNAQLHH